MGGLGWGGTAAVGESKIDHTQVLILMRLRHQILVLENMHLTF